LAAQSNPISANIGQFKLIPVYYKLSEESGRRMKHFSFPCQFSFGVKPCWRIGSSLHEYD